MKRNYQVPSIKVVSFKVEEGFQASTKNLYFGDQGDSEAQPPIEPTAGTQDFGFGSIFAS